MNTPIFVYAPNLSFRVDRKESILSQFDGRSEFDLTIVPAIELKNGPWALWQTFYGIVEKEAAKGSPFFIFCEDDHIFTEEYSFDNLTARIEEAENLKADLLSGGMSWIKYPVQVSKHLFWVAKFNGMQFTVIFNRLYQRILDCKTTEGYVLDIHLSNLAKRKFVIYPYISVQKEFGYSDATKVLSDNRNVETFFTQSSNKLEKLWKVKSHFAQFSKKDEDAIWQLDVSNYYLPTYIVNLPERVDRRKHIEKQFANHPEFDVHIIEASRHEVGTVGLWNSICKIVAEADSNKEDAILICEDDHIFTRDYNNSNFLHQVMQAASMGAQILSGGMAGMGDLVPLSRNLSWVSWFWGTQFIIIYRNAYRTILQQHFALSDTADGVLSSILTNKFVITPFISEQADFGYSDVTENNNSKGHITKLFDECKEELSNYDYVDNFILSGKVEGHESFIEYSQKQDVLRLNIGCGNNILPGWYNIDTEPCYGAYFMDAYQKFPICDNTLDYIFAEHFFDQIPYYRCLEVFKECFRTLKAGGVLRMTVCTVDSVLNMCRKSNDIESQQYAEWNLKRYSPILYRKLKSIHAKMPMPVVLNNFARYGTMKFMYNYEFLNELLRKSGFSEIKIVPINKSEYSFLRYLEHSSKYSPSWVTQIENISIEAIKIEKRPL